VPVLFASPASAHVTVRAENTTAGSSDVALTFRVPNERSDATVTRVDLEMPGTPPLPGVLVRPHPGWHATTRTVALDPPRQTDDGPITTVVAAVAWAADQPGDAIPVGGYDDFVIVVGQLPETPATLTFRATQTYSDGRVTRWISAGVPGQATPDDPAPTLTLTPAAGAQPTPAAPSTTTASIPTAGGWNGASTDTTARLLAGAALAVAMLACLLALLPHRRRLRGTTRVTADDKDGDRDEDRRNGNPGGGGPAIPPTTSHRRRPNPDPVPADAVRTDVPIPAVANAAARTARHGWRRAGQAPRWLRDLRRPAADLPARSRLLLRVAGLGALLATIAVFLPWATMTLSDRGEALLVVHSAGTAHNFRGPIVIVMSLVALIHVGLLRSRPEWRTRAMVLGGGGLAIVAIALSGIDDGQSVNDHISHMRVGTGEILDPVTTTAQAYGWWLTLAAGLVVAAGGLGTYRALRANRPSQDHLPTGRDVNQTPVMR